MASDELKERASSLFLSRCSEEELNLFFAQEDVKIVFEDLRDHLESKWAYIVSPEFATEYPHVTTKLKEDQESHSKFFIFFAIFVGINVYDLAVVTEFILKQKAEGTNPVMIPVGEIKGDKWTTAQRVLAGMAFYTQPVARQFRKTMICCVHSGLIDDHFTFSW